MPQPANLTPSWPPSPGFHDPYGADVLAANPHRQHRPQTRPVRAEVGMVLEHVQSGFVGAILRTEKRGGMWVVDLEDRRGKVRSFEVGFGFWLEGEPVELQPIVNSAATSSKPVKSRSGSRVTAHETRVARASRLWVEGTHDAELIEHVWGDDLRYCGTVVEILEGVDNLEAVLSEFQPTARRRAGVLVDHLVPGSKESRLVAEVKKLFSADSVLILGHPQVDIWQMVKPARFGLRTWPQIPREVDIKVGTLQALGLAAQTQADIAAGWKYILGRVRDFRDLEPAILAPVEQLIDFVTEPHMPR